MNPGETTEADRGSSRGENRRHVAVVGAGIAGLAAAVRLVQLGCEVTVIEHSPRVGGKLVSSRFGGLDNIDEGADAYLTRVPAAVGLADVVGVDDIKHPTDSRAAVWRNGLHLLPSGLMLGVPGSIRPLATTRLLSLRGKARALADLVLPQSDTSHDSIGALSRARLGDEVHDRLIDTLIGSIYATDTDRSSLAAVPQLAGLAKGRSLIVRARSATSSGASTPTPSAIFAAPADGMQGLARRCGDWLECHGARIELSSTTESIEPNGEGWRVFSDGGKSTDVDGVIIATPSSAAATIAARSGWVDAAAHLNAIETADVIMVRLVIPATEWPQRLAGLSGYLVPKPEQRWVTAASFGSQKWDQWHTTRGDQIVRISLGRDQMPTSDMDINTGVHTAVSEFSDHIGVDVTPIETSATRWVEGFPQYRPHHAVRVETLEATLPANIALAGASYRGIGIPACIASGQRAADGLAS